MNNNHIVYTNHLQGSAVQPVSSNQHSLLMYDPQYEHPMPLSTIYMHLFQKAPIIACGTEWRSAYKWMETVSTRQHLSPSSSMLYLASFPSGLRFFQFVHFWILELRSMVVLQSSKEKLPELVSSLESSYSKCCPIHLPWYSWCSQQLTIPTLYQDLFGTCSPQAYSLWHTLLKLSS